MQVDLIAPQVGEWAFVLVPGGVSGIPNAAQAVQTHVPKAGLVRIHPPQTAQANMAGVTSRPGTGPSTAPVVNLQAWECFCQYFPPAPPPAPSMPLGGGSVAVTPPGHTPVNSQTGQPGVSGLPPGFSGGYPGAGYGGWYDGSWWFPVAIGGGAPGYGGYGWGWVPSTWGYTGPGAYGWGPQAGMPPPQGKGTEAIPQPPPADQVRDADLEVSDAAFVALVGGGAAGAAAAGGGDTTGVADRATIAGLLSMVGVDRLAFKNPASTLPPPRYPTLPPNTVGVGDRVVLAIGVRPTAGDTIGVRETQPLGPPAAPHTGADVAVSDAGFFFSGATLCYGPVSVYDYASVHATYVLPPGVNPEQQGVFVLGDRALVFAERAPFGQESVGVSDVGRWPAASVLRGAGPTPAGVGDRAYVTLTPLVRVAASEVAGVADQASASAHLPAGWATLASDTTARDGLSAGYDSVNNVTYAIQGGKTSAGTAVDVLTGYSHTSKSWATLAAPPTGVVNQAGAFDSVDALAYSIDGIAHLSGNQALLQAYSYASDTWTTLASDLGTSANLAGTYDSAADLTYSIDGERPAGSVTAWLSAYSYTSNAWTQLAADSIARNSLAAAYDSAANLTYAIDGATSTAPQAGVTAYSHGSNAWTTIASDVARFQLAAAYDAGANVTYAIDGSSGATLTGYSHTSNSWTTLSSDPSGSRGLLAAAYDSADELTIAIDGSESGTQLTTVTAYRS